MMTAFVELPRHEFDALVQETKESVRVIGSVYDALYNARRAILNAFASASGVPTFEDPLGWAATSGDLRRALDNAAAVMRRTLRDLGTHIGEPRSLSILQDEVLQWQQRNFPGQRSHEPALGVPEEAGELWEAAFQLLSLGRLSALVGRLCHAELKLEQSIRGTPDELQAKLEDAIGDLVIFVVDLCNTRGLDLQRIVDRTWEAVSKRDWQRDPVAGGSHA